MALNAAFQQQETRPPRTDYDSLSVAPLTPVLGAEVAGIDLSCELSNQQLADLHQAHLDHGVLVFRDQRLSREDHKRFARHFGPLHVHPLNRKDGDDAEEDPEILLVKTTKNSKFTAGDGWHTDVTCDARPPLGSMLYITKTPDLGCGGDTLFTSTYAAYEALSEPMKQFLSGLTAIHDGARPYIGSYNIAPPEGGYPRSEHPVIGVHPETGRKLLYVNSGFTTRIRGLSPAESDAVLDMLFRHIEANVRFQCRVRWEPNTLVFWDNRCTQHHAAWDYYPYSRYGERVSIIGDPPGPVN